MRNIIEYLRCNLDDGQDILLTMDEAHRVVEGYDAITHAAHWTHEPPKVAGWYWYQLEGHTTILKKLDIISYGEKHTGFIDGWPVDILSTKSHVKWAGPIAPPVE